MKTRFRIGYLAFTLLCGASACFFSHPTLAQNNEKPSKLAEGDGSLTPVESDPHEFMEYMFQPTFKRLKPAMSQKPSGDDGWLEIKSGALILAEGANLLMIRPPKKDGDDWIKHATEVRHVASQVYQAAHSKNFDSARKHFETMVTKCNECHRHFAGKEQISID